MKKIAQGEFEIHTTKKDAINKFMQLTGVCREEISDDKPIEFRCTKTGKIAISNPPTTLVTREISTKLFGKVIERDGKTFTTFQIMYNGANNVIKIIYLTLMLISTVLAFFIDKTTMRVALIFSFLLFDSLLFSATKEKNNLTFDSEMLIKELEKRVNAINSWDE